MLSICIALSHNFTVKSLPFCNKSHNESPNVKKKTASEQASRHDTRYAIKVITMIILKQLKYKMVIYML